jgi:hypothetical protein
MADIAKSKKNKLKKNAVVQTQYAAQMSIDCK